MIEACSAQMRHGFDGPLGLDYPAVLAFAGLAGPLSAEAADLLGDALPEVEAVIMTKLKTNRGDAP